MDWTCGIYGLEDAGAMAQLSQLSQGPAHDRERWRNKTGPQHRRRTFLLGGTPQTPGVRLWLRTTESYRGKGVAADSYGPELVNVGYDPIVCIRLKSPTKPSVSALDERRARYLCRLTRIPTAFSP